MLDVRDAPKELRAIVLALSTVGPDLRREINKQTREAMNPVWKSEIESRISRGLDAKVLGNGVRIKAGNPAVAQAAQSRKRTSGGMLPNEQWSAIEFGGDRGEVTTYYRKSPKGTRHKVQRHASRQLLPRSKGGRVVFPAFKALAPRLVSLWAATVVRSIYDAFEKGK